MKQLMNMRVKRQIDAYINSMGMNLVLKGNKGMGKRAIAEQIAMAFFELEEPEELSNCSNFILLEPVNGTITADMVVSISEKIMYLSDKKYIILIDDADKMTEYVQNKLLKLLEDNNEQCIFILICHSELIDTIYSRCAVIEIPLFSIMELREWFQTEDEKMVAIYASNGTPGNYIRICNDAEFLKALNQYMTVLSSIQKRTEMRKVFEVLNCVREKDSSFYGEKWEEWQFEAFFNLNILFLQDMLACRFNGVARTRSLMKSLSNIYEINEILFLIDESKKYILMNKNKGQFNKNDFMEYIMKLYTPSAFYGED